MSKSRKIFYQLAIAVNILAGITSIVSQNYLLGVNQFLVSWFIFMYYKEINK
jgi:hypothetical protein